MLLCLLSSITFDQHGEAPTAVRLLPLQVKALNAHSYATQHALLLPMLQGSDIQGSITHTYPLYAVLLQHLQEDTGVMMLECL